MTVVTGLLIRGSRCDRAISAAEIDAIQQQPGHYSATLWDKIADWFCGTDKANALKALAETCDGSKSCKERTTAFFKLKDLAADTYKNRFHSTLDKDGITFSINDDKNSPVVTARLTPSEWQRQWDVLDGNSADEEKHAAFLALKAMAGTPYQDRFQSTLEEKGMTLSITATESGAAVVNPLTPSGWIDAWTTLQNGEKTPDERIQAFSTLQRLAGETGKDRFDIHPTKDGILLTITDSQNKPVFKETLPWHGLLDKNKGLAVHPTKDGIQLTITDSQNKPVFKETLTSQDWTTAWNKLTAEDSANRRQAAFITLQELAGDAGKDWFHVHPTQDGIQLTIIGPQSKEPVFKATLTSQNWTTAWSGLVDQHNPLHKRLQAFRTLQTLVGNAGKDRFHAIPTQDGIQLTIIGPQSKEPVFKATLTSQRWTTAWPTLANEHRPVAEREAAFFTLQALAGDAGKDWFHVHPTQDGIQLTITDSQNKPVFKETLTPQDWTTAWKTLAEEHQSVAAREAAFFTLQALAGDAGKDRFHAFPTQDGIQLTITDSQNQPVFMKTQVPSGWTDAWATLKDKHKTADEKQQAFATLQRLAGRVHFAKNIDSLWQHNAITAYYQKDLDASRYPGWVFDGDITRGHYIISLGGQQTEYREGDQHPEDHKRAILAAITEEPFQQRWLSVLATQACNLALGETMPEYVFFGTGDSTYEITKREDGSLLVTTTFRNTTPESMQRYLPEKAEVCASQTGRKITQVFTTTECKAQFLITHDRIEVLSCTSKGEKPLPVPPTS